MAGRIGAKLIMELREQGASRRSIASSRRMSMGSVCEVFDIAAERGVTWEQVRDMPENEVCRLFYPGRHARGSVFEEPDWDYAHKEMAKVGVNLRPLHDECKAGRAARHAVAMGCTKFCEGYGDRVAASGPTKRIEHKAGVSCEVGWSGPTPGGGLVDPVAGEVPKAYPFVGVPPFSQKAHFEPALDVEGRTWPRCRVHMLEYRGGVPGRAACDDLETGVVKRPREGGIVLNDAYEAPGEHHMTAITPAQARKPKQEASAEGTVGDAATRVTARLRDRVFTGLGELPHAVRECLGDYSAHPFQKREGSRDPVFSEVEAERLRPLPAVRYDVAQRACNRSVGLDFHVVHAKNRYSAPCRCAGCKADLRVGESTVGIYHAGERVAAHPLPPPYASNAHQTDPSHTPNGPRRPERDDARIKRRAAGVGPCCAAVAGRISEGVKIRERAYNPAPSAPGPSKGYGGRRLEAACAHAPPKPRSPRRRRLKATPGSGPDAGRGPEGKAAPAGGPRGHVRGADHYRDGARRPGGGGAGGMVDEETRRKPRETGMGEMVGAPDLREADGTVMSAPFEDRVRTMVDYACEEKRAASVRRLAAGARLRFPDAEMGSMIHGGRGLDAVLTRETGACRFVSSAANVAIEGCAGTGKSHLACRLAEQACRMRGGARYVRLPDLPMERDELAATERPNAKILGKYARYGPLVLDERPTEDVDGLGVSFPFELVERRHMSGSTVPCTRYAPAEWHERLGGGVQADTMVDRLVRGSVRIDLGDVNVRKMLAERRWRYAPAERAVRRTREHRYGNRETGGAHALKYSPHPGPPPGPRPSASARPLSLLQFRKLAAGQKPASPNGQVDARVKRPLNRQGVRRIRRTVLLEVVLGDKRLDRAADSSVLIKTRHLVGVLNIGHLDARTAADAPGLRLRHRELREKRGMLLVDDPAPPRQAKLLRKEVALDHRAERRHRHAADQRVLGGVGHVPVVASLAFVVEDQARTRLHQFWDRSLFNLPVDVAYGLQGVLHRFVPDQLAFVLGARPLEELGGVADALHQHLRVRDLEPHVLEHVELRDAEDVVVGVETIVRFRVPDGGDDPDRLVVAQRVP